MPWLWLGCILLCIILQRLSINIFILRSPWLLATNEPNDKIHKCLLLERQGKNNKHEGCRERERERGLCYSFRGLLLLLLSFDEFQDAILRGGRDYLLFLLGFEQFHGSTFRGEGDYWKFGQIDYSSTGCKVIGNSNMLWNFPNISLDFQEMY